MAKTTPLLKDGKLYVWDEYEQNYIVNGEDMTDHAEWPYWLEFLKMRKSLRVVHTTHQGFTLSFSCYRQKHPNHPLGFWYAHKRVDNKLRRMYIGKDENMTVERLAEIAEEISQGKLPT
jgi:hypothetical protein